VGKSWDMLEEAYCLATGQAVYGHFAVPRRRKVMIIEEEDSRRRIRRRLRCLIHAHGGTPPGDAWFRYAVKQGVRLDDPAWQEVIAWEIRAFRPEFVYLDVFTRLHAQDINDQVAMTKIILFLDRLSHEHGCTFIILHHDRKNPGGGDDHDEILGSRVLGGFGEASLFFARTKERGVLRVKVALKDEPEDGRFEPEFLIKLSNTEDREGTRFSYLGIPQERTAARELRVKIKRWVLAQGTFVTAQQVGNACHCSKPTAREHLDALADAGALVRGRHGQAYLYGAPETPESDAMAGDSPAAE
jgi:AAA domain